MSRSTLLSALLSEETYTRLYTEHTGFHFAVDGLVAMLPGLVAGMASQAMRDEAGKLEVLQELRDQAGEITWSASSGGPTEEESAAEVQAAFEQGEKGVTALPAARKRAPRKAPAKKTAKKTTRRYR